MKLSAVVKLFLPLIFIITFTCGLVLWTTQQNYRLNANDPQIQIVEDVTSALLSGMRPESIAPSTKTDIGKSLAPFIMIFDESGKMLASSVTLDGKTPEVPAGVFAYTKASGQDRFSWQPKPGVRAATVLNYYKGTNSSGFVLVGRSLREVEKREEFLKFQIGLAWIAGFIGSIILSIIPVALAGRKTKKN